MRNITKIIIHCSATPEGREVSVNEISSWHRQRGANCRGHNHDSIGVCYIGGCDHAMHPKDTRTTAQRASLRQIVTELRRQFPGATVHGHCEFAAKACPSFDVGRDL